MTIGRMRCLIHPEVKRFAQSDTLGQGQGCLIAQLQEVPLIHTISYTNNGGPGCNKSALTLSRAPSDPRQMPSGSHRICIYMETQRLKAFIPPLTKHFTCFTVPFGQGFSTAGRLGYRSGYPVHSRMFSCIPGLDH